MDGHLDTRRLVPAQSPDGGRPAVVDADGSPALRMQILATEHWSLLASRSTTQSEVLTRIAIFLTLVSAGLVSLGIFGQATGFSADFGRAAIGVLAFLVLVGVLTWLRVANASNEDLMYVVAMNRIRAAYEELDPGVAPYFMASAHDDMLGSQRTYFFFSGSRKTHGIASSAFFLGVITAVLVGLLVGTIAAVLGAAAAAAVIGGLVAGCAVTAILIVVSLQEYVNIFRTHEPLSPTPR